MFRRLLISLLINLVLAAPAAAQWGPGPHGPEPMPPGRHMGPPHGPAHPGYGPYARDAEAWQWLAFTAITLRMLDLLNEQQLRAHEAAQIRAVSAPIGQPIVWNDGGASGAVTATRDGTSATGAYCREFQQEVTIGGRTERAYGTACRQPDGAWKVVSTGN